MHPQGQGHQEIHHPQHGRVCCYSYVKTTGLQLPLLQHPCSSSSPAMSGPVRPIVQPANKCLSQVTSLTPRSLPSTPSPRCTSSCSTASLVPFTARSFGTFVLDGGQLCLVWCRGGPMGKPCTCQTQAAEKNLGGIRTPSPSPLRPRNKHADRNTNSVRSREGRRNRAPPPRVRYNKDGKKITPTQGAKTS